jgi:hypothetical protein
LLNMTLRSAVRWLLVLVLGLPVVQAALVWVGGLLAAMGDATGAAVVRRVGTAAGVAWLLALVGLVIALAMRSLEASSEAQGDD